MPEFQMPHASGESVRAFAALDPFVQGYVEALFFTDCTPDDRELADMTFDDLAPGALAVIVRDCEEFQHLAVIELGRAYERDYDSTQAGRDFHFTRNGHGVGFWDRKVLEAGGLGERLTVIAKTFRSLDAYAGDNGRMYLA